MARVRFAQSGSDFFGSLRQSFTNTQIDFFDFFNNRRSFASRFSSKTYTIQSSFFDFNSNQSITVTSEIKGKLNQSLPDQQKKVKSVELNLSFENGGGFAVKFDKITGLKLSEYKDPGFDSLKKALSGNDEIRSVPGSVLLTGFRGDDEIFLESRNRALGGAGNDRFFFTPNTRQAEILDFNPGKDRLTVLNDTADNYQIFNTFGQSKLQNLNGETILTFENLNNPELARNLTLDDVFGLGGSGGSGGDPGNITV